MFYHTHTYPHTLYQILPFKALNIFIVYIEMTLNAVRKREGENR